MQGFSSIRHKLNLNHKIKSRHFENRDRLLQVAYRLLNTREVFPWLRLGSLLPQYLTFDIP